MSLQTRRPPGHGKRKALAYAADIVRLRDAGHSLMAIREALEDVGLVVSISTVRREVLKGALNVAPGSSGSVQSPAPAAPRTPPGDDAGRRGAASKPALVPQPSSSCLTLPGKTIAEAFVRGRPTNTLFLKEPPK